jgi:hypothetical protein
MTPENISGRLASQFQSLRQESISDNEEMPIFSDLENTLNEKGFDLGDTADVLEVLYNNSLVCRSESFSKVIDLIDTDTTIVIKNKDSHANMCTMSSGTGFKIAMVEGFSGKDVGAMVKVVISFKSTNLSSRVSVPRDNELWQTKPETAQVSIVGSGEIQKEDVEMVSFRFPIKYYPASMLTEQEKDSLEEQNISFVVRHYLPNKKETVQ